MAKATAKPTTKPAAKPSGASDIRAFFGGSQGSQKQSAQSSQPETSKGSSKTVAIEIDDDETPPPPKSTAKPDRHPTKVEVTPQKAPKRKTALISDDDEDEKPLKKPHQSDTKPRPSTSRSSVVSRKRKSSAIQLSSDEEDDVSPPKKRIMKKAAAMLSSEDDEPPAAPKTKPPTKPRASVKAKAPRDDDFNASDSDADGLVPKKGAKSEKKVTAKGKVENKDEPAKEAPKKPNWAALKAARMAGPSNPGSKEVPEGEPDCLVPLSFVFTGELSSFSREEAVDIAKRYGGRVVGQPSSKTDYVVLGADAGPSKLAAIKKHGINTLSEDEFLNLVATRKGPSSGNADAKLKKKLEKEQADIKATAKQMEKSEKAAAAASYSTPGSSRPKSDPLSQLWTTKYAPQNLKDICGNKSVVDKVLHWLEEWPKSVKSGFKKPGKDGMNMFRAILLHGGPGIGKTTTAHLCAKAAGFTPIELNASDARSKKLVENGMNVNNTSLDGFFSGGKAVNSAGMVITDKTCIIMDEVDGMSAGDRGGVGALNALIKKTKVPIICIANDGKAQKLKPLMSTTYGMTFSKPTAAQIRSRMLSIAFKEGMKIPANVMDQLISGSQSDIRQVLNMLSTWKLSSKEMNFDEGKDLVKVNEKYHIMSPFDITSKMLGPYLFSHTARETLGDKMELYFQDHSFVPLFIQENYLKPEPAKVRSLDGPEKTLELLRVMDKAASSLSDGDLVDGMIHGPEQHWALMPLHAVCSTIRPASYMYGAGMGYNGPNGLSFPQWLGQNSKQNKLNRALSDVQIRMRLKVSGDKHDIRQSYIPALFPHLVKPLMDSGADAIEEVITRMDDYYLSKEDWDTIVELGVDKCGEDIVLKKIPSAAKGSFTRKYNLGEHPIAFHKAQDLGKAPKKLAAGPAPDIEDAFDAMDEVIEDASDTEVKDVDEDPTKDKLIQAPKKKKAKVAATKAGKAGKK